jgi:predicted RNase H-like nuclease (RuvC/YqgF family)
MENFPQEERKGFVRDTMRKLSIHMPRSEASFQSKLAQYEIEIKDLQERIRVVEHDSESLVRHLEKTISHYEALKRKYHQSLEQLTQGKKTERKARRRSARGQGADQRSQEGSRKAVHAPQ